MPFATTRGFYRPPPSILMRILLWQGREGQPFLQIFCIFCKKGAFPVQYDVGTHACTHHVHPLTKRKEDLKGYAIFFTVSVLPLTASLKYSSFIIKCKTARFKKIFYPAMCLRALKHYFVRYILFICFIKTVKAQPRFLTFSN